MWPRFGSRYDILVVDSSGYLIAGLLSFGRLRPTHMPSLYNSRDIESSDIGPSLFKLIRVRGGGFDEYTFSILLY